MDVAKKAYAALTQVVQSMTPGARVACALLIGLVVVCMGYLARRPSTVDTFLLGGEAFGGAQLNTMEAAFAKAGLKTYELQGNRVQVPRAEQSAYMAALADAGALPPDFGKFMEKAISNSSSPLVDKSEREAMLKVALQNELRLIIRSMKGIENASVLYDAGERPTFGPRTITASVSVKPVGSQPLEEERILMLRGLVASSIAGLKPENVTVTDLNGRLYPAGPESTGASLGGDSYSARKRMYERDWVTKISGALSYIPGVLVTANVELDTEREHEENEVHYDPPQTSNGSQTPPVAADRAPAGDANRTADGTAAEPYGDLARLIIAPPNDAAAHRSPVANHSKHVLQQGLTPKRVTITVGIPSGYYEKIWYEKHAARSGMATSQPDDGELAAIEAQVKDGVGRVAERLLPLADATADASPRVVVTSFQNIRTPAPAPAIVSDWSAPWLDLLSRHGGTLALVALAGFGLIMLRSIVRAPRASAAIAAHASAAPAEQARPLSRQEFDDVEEHLAGNHWNHVAQRASLRDELADMVREDPDAAVSVLRSWIGNAS